MQKFKDFLYDKNDIVIVILIVAVAAFIIYTRIDSIMGYPEQYASEVAATETKATVKITEPSEEETVAEDAEITIDDTDTSSSVADKLYEAGLIDSDDDFESFVNDEGKSDSIQSGTFQIPSGSSYEEILDIIT